MDRIYKDCFYGQTKNYELWINGLESLYKGGTMDCQANINLGMILHVRFQGIVSPATLVPPPLQALWSCTAAQKVQVWSISNDRPPSATGGIGHSVVKP